MAQNMSGLYTRLTMVVQAGSHHLRSLVPGRNIVFGESSHPDATYGFARCPVDSWVVLMMFQDV